jgi:hypothetical protein
MNPRNCCSSAIATGTPDPAPKSTVAKSSTCVRANVRTTFSATNTCAQHELREQPAARDRQHQDLAELRREHAPQREFANGAAELGVDGGGGAGRIDVAEYAQYQRAGVGLGDVATHEPDFERASGPCRDELRLYAP